MKIVAVVTELNPFHYGHKYLLQEAKKLSGCDAVLCIMSGQFVQRGSPAIVSMRTRAKMALLNGADLVTELPVLYATACGERFSEGAINIANSTKEITHLAFGSECGDLQQLQKIAEI
ncbi:MAG: nucleotidyltransferase family protein, partial [Firmicutes bacterium]|nr:nucleotidyltransferase family protein [Bacillota bacterium]